MKKRITLSALELVPRRGNIIRVPWRAFDPETLRTSNVFRFCEPGLPSFPAILDGLPLTTIRRLVRRAQGLKRTFMTTEGERLRGHPALILLLALPLLILAQEPPRMSIILAICILALLCYWVIRMVLPPMARSLRTSRSFKSDRSGLTLHLPDRDAFLPWSNLRSIAGGRLVFDSGGEKLIVPLEAFASGVLGRELRRRFFGRCERDRFSRFSASLLIPLTTIAMVTLLTADHSFSYYRALMNDAQATPPSWLPFCIPPAAILSHVVFYGLFQLMTVFLPARQRRSVRW